MRFFYDHAHMACRKVALQHICFSRISLAFLLKRDSQSKKGKLKHEKRHIVQIEIAIIAILHNFALNASL